MLSEFKEGIMPTTVIFYSVNDKFRLGADTIQKEERYNDGRVKTPSLCIEFFGGVYQTESKKEVDVIKASNEYKLGRVRIISETELDILMATKAGKISGITENPKDYQVPKVHETTTSSESDNVS